MTGTGGNVNPHVFIVSLIFFRNRFTSVTFGEHIQTRTLLGLWEITFSTLDFMYTLRDDPIMIA